MFSYIWHTFFFDPIYNSLVFFIDVMPGGDVGLAIIATVILVKLILLPVSIKAVQTQKAMRDIDPKLKAIKEEHKDNREEQAKAMMAVYKEAKINPFASLFVVLLQIPIIIALYYSVYSGGGVALPNINVDILYSFIKAPVELTMNFLGIVDITGKSIVLALLAGITQYIQVRLVMPKLPERLPDAKPSMKDEMMRNMHVQMRFVMPVLIAVIAYTISAAIALYFLVSNIVTIAQEIYVKKHR
jgi:YidC/Oxa1 family membrane protein insertase